MATGSALDRLQKWFVDHCNGDWEHGFGIQIDTLDNPGWRVKIHTEETDLAGRTFDRLEFDRSDDDWLRCWVSETAFEVACGPLNLTEGLDVFLAWADSSNL